MKNNTIIANIRYAYDLDTFSTAFRPERVYSAIENFDYFFNITALAIENYLE